jgi:YD repeat-containing protein
MRIATARSRIGRRVRALLAAASIGFPLLTGAPAGASETISYIYDARGRLKQVAHSGTVNNGVTTTYAHDKADNRTSKTTIGAP